MGEQIKIFCLTTAESEKLFAAIHKYTAIENQKSKYEADLQKRDEHSKNYIFMMRLLSKLQAARERLPLYDKFTMNMMDFFELNMVMYLIQESEDLTDVMAEISDSKEIDAKDKE